MDEYLLLQIATTGVTDLFITTYNVTFSDPTTGNVDSAIVNVQTASATITPPVSLCPFTITVTADTGFEQEQLSNPVTVGMLNREIDPKASNIFIGSYKSPPFHAFKSMLNG